jgi:AmmeMemoRadiSam system protein B
MPALSPEEIRAAMAIPSTDRMRGLKDGIGFPVTPEAMAAVYAASTLPPQPAPFGPAPLGPAVGAIAPHDDFLYAGRVLRRALERIEANTVVIVGTFHRYRDVLSGFGMFDSRETWWSPDGPVPVSGLTEAVIAQMSPWPAPVTDSAHDQEHSIEPIVAWLRHENPNVEILPILPPGGPIDVPCRAGWLMGTALRKAMLERGLEVGRDVAVVISADAIHYGPDFDQTRYGPGGLGAYEKAVAEDHRLLREHLSGEIKNSNLLEFFHELVEERDSSRYRWTWCGRFAIPFGLSVLKALRGDARLMGWPVAYETSMSAPPLDVSMPPLGFTAPASYDHFVGYPAVMFTFAPPRSP